MPALVPELVNAAIDASVSPGDLLRRALVVARRLAVPELVDWISSELNGYYSGEAGDIAGSGCITEAQVGHHQSDRRKHQSRVGKRGRWRTCGAGAAVPDGAAVIASYLALLWMGQKRQTRQ